MKKLDLHIEVIISLFPSIIKDIEINNYVCSYVGKKSKKCTYSIKNNLEVYYEEGLFYFEYVDENGKKCKKRKNYSFSITDENTCPYFYLNFNLSGIKEATIKTSTFSSHMKRYIVERVYSFSNYKVIFNLEEEILKYKVANTSIAKNSNIF